MSNRAISKVQAAIIIVIIIVGVAAGAYITAKQNGVTGPNQPQSTTAVSVPNPDTLTIETIGQPDSLDPATDYEIRGANVIQNLYEQLLFFAGPNASQVVPWLAQSYDLSPDGLTYTFHLRSGITFSDGTPVDANAVYYSLMRAMIIDDPDGPAWAMLQVLRGGQNYSKQYNNAGPSAPTGYGDKYTQAEVNDFVNAKPVEVIDTQTVALHLERPYAAWPFVMAFTVTAIVSPTAFKAHWTAPTDGTGYIQGATGGDYTNRLNPWPASNAVGSGPYVVQSWDKETETVVLVRNEHYWGGPSNRGIAPIKNVIVKGVDDANTRILDFKTGTADIIGIPPSITSVMSGGLTFEFADKNTWFSQHKLVSLSPDYQLFPTDELWPQFNTQGVGFNQQILGPDRKPVAFQPFSDVRIRKAFTLAFNRTSYLHDVMQDFGVPASQIIPPGMFGYNPTIQPTPYDLNAAKQLLLDAGANPMTPNNTFSPKNQKSVEFEYIIGYASDEAAATLLATAINSMSSETGLSASVVGIAGPQFHTLQYSHQLQVIFVGWYVDYVDPDDFLVPFGLGKVGYYAPTLSYDNPKVDQLIAEQGKTTDPTQRLQLINQIQQLVNDDYAYLWLNYGAAYSLSRSWVHERANASVASGIERNNAAIYGYFLLELQKGSQISPSSSATQVSFLALGRFLNRIELPAIALSIKKTF
jgi:peptide/nickel transport system substrate-binding protein